MILALSTVFTVVFLVLGVPLVIAELIGVFRKKRGDTISENWFWLRNRIPPLVIPMTMFLVWLLYHFIVEGWGI